MTEPEVVLPGQHEVGAGVVGPRPCGAPLDGVDLLTVGLQVVDTRVLLHAPDLDQGETGTDQGKRFPHTQSVPRPWFVPCGLGSA